MLKSNKLSNRHGTSWSLGLVFTLLATCVFYAIYLSYLHSSLELDFSWNGFGQFMRHFIQLLNITEWEYEPFGVNNAPWGDMILYVSRIAIASGYYQTIQAFRKLSQN